jgi:glutaredoxin
MIRLLSRKARPPRRWNAEHLAFTVFTRKECCCCHKAIDLLREYQARAGFSLEEVDIDADPDLRARFDTSVPVVAVNGQVRFKGVVNPALLERLLDAEGQRR